MPINRLRAISRKGASQNQAVTAMLKASSESDDRGAAVSGGALVDFALEKAIKVRLRRMSRSEYNDLFEGTAPLATFSGKVKMAYALGIIHKEAKHDLESINAIRNAFAHSVHELTFRNRAVRQKLYGIHKLKAAVGDRRHVSEAREDYLGMTRTFWFELVVMVGPRVTVPLFPAFMAIKEPRRRARSIKKKISETTSSGGQAP